MTGADKVMCQAATLLLLFTADVDAGEGAVRRLAAVAAAKT